MSLQAMFNNAKSRFDGKLLRSTGQGRWCRRRAARALLLERLESRVALTAYLQTNLAADQPGVALIHDPELIDAWGISINPVGTFWVSARATDVSTVYSGDVTQPDGTRSPFVKSALTVTVPGGAPTGQVFSASATDFIVSSGAASAPARFIFAGDGGHITGWSPVVPAPPPPPPSRQAQLTATTPGAVYTGLAIGNNAAGTFLYAADFHNSEIDVFDRTYAPTTLAGAFVDPGIPSGYSAFNIWNLDGKLYVTYAKQDNGDALPDGGTGFVSIFDTEGNFLQRLVSETRLNEPWGLALAPADFGEFSGAVLVGNFGDGHINAFDSASGEFLGRLAGETGEAVHIDGLLGLHFGNGTASGDRNALYFAAAPDAGAHGLFGSLRPGPAQIASVVVNDGAAQRSMVSSLTVTFDGPVTIDPGAFELRSQSGALIELAVATSIAGGRTVAVLTFPGADIIGGSLADGNYLLTVHSELIHDALGRELDGDGDGDAGGDGSEEFFRLFGDSDGDRDVDRHDLGLFVSTLGHRRGQSRYLDYLDFNQDDRIGVIDLLAFVRRLGDQLPP